MRETLAPYCVEVTSSEWSQLARSEWIQNALARRWCSLVRDDGKLRCVLGRRSIEFFCDTGKRLWRYTDLEVEFLRALQTIIERMLAEETRPTTP